jgi:phage shock protein C
MRRRLYRSRTDVVWAGVAGGVAQWLDLDPSLVRVAWVVLTPLTGFVAGLVYLVMWVVVPEAPAASVPGPGAAAGVATEPRDAAAEGTDPRATAPTTQWTASAAPARRETSAPIVAGLILIGLGAFFLLRDVLSIDWDRIWPLALVVIGAALLFGTVWRRD